MNFCFLVFLVFLSRPKGKKRGGIEISSLSLLPYIAMKSSPSPTLPTRIPLEDVSDADALPPAARGGISEPQMSLETLTSQQSKGSADVAAKATSAGAGGAGTATDAGAPTSPKWPPRWWWWLRPWWWLLGSLLDEEQVEENEALRDGGSESPPSPSLRCPLLTAAAPSFPLPAEEEAVGESGDDGDEGCSCCC